MAQALLAYVLFVTSGIIGIIKYVYVFEISDGNFLPVATKAKTEAKGEGHAAHSHAALLCHSVLFRR